MKKIKLISTIILLIILLPEVVFSQEREGKVREELLMESLYGTVERLLESAPQNPDSLIKVSDLIITMSDNPVIKASIAGYLFNYFSSSKIMGHENVAVYIAKNYFLNGRLEWSGDGGVALLRLYTEFNENSLLGKDAPELSLTETNGNTLTLSSIGGRYTVLYFFDDQCSLCKEQFPSIRNTISDYLYLNPLVYAVFTRVDSAALNNFIKTNFGSADAAKKQGWSFVYDSKSVSNFHKLYNVLKTPQMFLINSSNKIIGRGLDNISLTKLFEQESSRIGDIYSQAEDFAPKYLSIFNLKDTSEYKEAFDPLFTRLSNDNTEMYNAVFYNLFELLRSEDEQYLKDVALYIAKKYMLPYPALWFDKTYINEVVPAKIRRIELNSPGSLVADISLKTMRGKEVPLSTLRSDHTILYFFNPDCSACQPLSFEFKQLYRSFRKKRITIVAISTISDRSELKKYIRKNRIPWRVFYTLPQQREELINKFEIERIPQTYLLNSKGVILEKRIGPTKIKELLL
jgi:peroxiredoxin